MTPEPPPLVGPAPSARSGSAGPGTRQLAVEADLGIEFVTQTGQHATGRLTGDGQRLTLNLDRPELLVGEFGPALVGVGRSRITGLTGQLAEAHVRVDLQGPGGRIASFDPTERSRIAALLTGSPHITIAPAAWSVAWRSFGPTARAAAVAGVALAAALVVAVELSSRSMPRRAGATTRS